MKNVILKSLFLFQAFYSVSMGLIDASVRLPGSELIGNFADAIVNQNGTKFLAVFEIQESLNERSHELSKNSWYNSPLGLSFMEERFRLLLPGMAYSYCGSIDPVIYIKDELNQISGVDRIKKIPLGSGTKWVAVLDTMYDNSGELIFYGEIDKLGFENITKYNFINKKSFFRVPLPQSENAICLEWNRNLGFELRTDVSLGDEAFLEDVKKLISLFCNRKYEPLEGIELINDARSSLRTDLGKQIAQEMIGILEKKIIESLKVIEGEGKSL